MQKKLIITVYAISKNEEKFVDRWVKSMSEADNIVVLDTGSTDNTVKKLTERGVYVTVKNIFPWRFDTARNESLKLVPKNTDICVCTDLDEVFMPGWRKKIEEKWNEKTKLLKYKYVWNILSNGQDGITFFYEKIHSLKGFKWVYPVHEILKHKPLNTSEIAICKDLVLKHYPDNLKSRGGYLKLLEQSVKEHPSNDRNTHYLAREYMFYGKYLEAIKTFKKHLNLKSSTWADERSASLRYMGDCYYKLNKLKLAKRCYKKAILQSFNTREPYLSLAIFYYEQKDYLNCIFVLNNMLNITTKNLTYITNPNCWNDFPFDMLSFCYFNLGQYVLAYSNTEKALLLNPTDERLKNNLSILKKYI